VTVRDAGAEPSVMMRYGIPQYRLPRDIQDAGRHAARTARRLGATEAVVVYRRCSARDAGQPAHRDTLFQCFGSLTIEKFGWTRPGCSEAPATIRAPARP
jgi:hypothetical protein